MISGLQSCADVQASGFARHPSRSYRHGSVDPLGSRGFSVRADDGLLPPRPSDMLAVRIGPLTAWGLTPHKMRGLAGRSSNEHPVGRGHAKEAKRGPPCGHRITRNDAAMVWFLLPCAITWLSLNRWVVLDGYNPSGSAVDADLDAAARARRAAQAADDGVVYVPQALYVSPTALPMNAQRVARFGIVSGRRVFCKIQVDNLASVTEVSLAWSVGYGSNQARLTTMFRFSVATWIGNAAAV
jgi:hypothetical protein